MYILLSCRLAPSGPREFRHSEAKTKAKRKQASKKIFLKKEEEARLLL